jgi:iron complex transport system permease protein
VLVLGICLLVAGSFSLSWGQMKIPFLHVAAGLAQGMELPLLTQVPVPADEMAVIWHIRLP